MKNILMNTEMTKAILDGHKTQTRRVIKDKELIDLFLKNGGKKNKKEVISRISKYKKDETIWVREPAKIDMCFTEEIHFHYLADNTTSKLNIPKRFIKDGFVADWMAHCNGVPNGCIKEMARIFLKITDVRVEMLFDLTYDDMQEEGYSEAAMNSISGLNWYIDLWNKTAPKGYKWDDNPYVFVYEFERVKEK